MKVYKGTVLTVNRTDEVARVLVEDRGRIVYVGNELPERYAAAPAVDLGARALIPSFCDTHQHFASFSLFHAGLNVMECASNSEILENIRAFRPRCREKVMIAFGASPYSVKERRLISREELDAVCPDKEIMVVKYDGHACITNSRLLKKLDPKVRGLRGYHPDRSPR